MLSSLCESFVYCFIHFFSYHPWECTHATCWCGRCGPTQSRAGLVPRVEGWGPGKDIWWWGSLALVLASSSQNRNLTHSVPFLQLNHILHKPRRSMDSGPHQGVKGTDTGVGSYRLQLGKWASACSGLKHSVLSLLHSLLPSLCSPVPAPDDLLSELFRVPGAGHLVLCTMPGLSARWAWRPGTQDTWRLLSRPRVSFEYGGLRTAGLLQLRVSRCWTGVARALPTWPQRS